MSHLPRVGISSCLLGQPVRYDGRGKRSAFLVEQLGPHVTWVPVCPELEVGMGVPRESVRLVQQGDRLGMYGTSSARDWTAIMEGFACDRVEGLASAELAGYVLKARSPSCGLAAVPRFADVTDTAAPIVAEGPGLFAAALRRRLPHLPLVEEAAFDDLPARESFLTALFAHHRLQAFWATPWRNDDLRAFHAAHETLLLAHHQPGLRALERLLDHAALPAEELKTHYQSLFLQTLAQAASPAAHADALERLAAHLSGKLDPPARAQLSAAIEAQRFGRVSRIQPITLLRQYAQEYELTYVLRQHYLAPFPDPLFAAV